MSTRAHVHELMLDAADGGGDISASRATDIAMRFVHERDAWRKLALAREKVCLAYRLNRPTPERALDEIRSAMETLNLLSDQERTTK